MSRPESILAITDSEEEREACLSRAESTTALNWIKEQYQEALKEENASIKKSALSEDKKNIKIAYKLSCHRELQTWENSKLISQATEIIIENNKAQHRLKVTEVPHNGGCNGCFKVLVLIGLIFVVICHALKLAKEQLLL